MSSTIFESVKPAAAPNIRQRFMEMLALGALVLAIGLPRGLELGRFMTPDERLWLGRSGNFYYALTHQDFASTFQKGHPGVTIMWAGAAGYLAAFPNYRNSRLGQLEQTKLETFLQNRAPDLPLKILITARRIMVLLHTVVLALSFVFALRLFGLLPALVGFLLIAFDPFHLALTRILHLDGLLANLLLLSLLAFLNYLEEHRRPALLVSAVAAGFAWLTKSPGLILIPLIGLLTLADFLYRVRERGEAGWGKKLRHYGGVLAGWAGIAGLTFCLFWPAMWVDPTGSLQKIFDEGRSYAEEGHNSALFFKGKIFANGEIPDLSFYPTNFLWRTTPVTLFGLLAAFVAFILKERPLNEDRQRRAAVAMLLFSLGFLVLMNLSTKKFDRYILPSFLPLDLLAGAGLAGLASWAARTLRRRWAAIRAAPLLAGALLVGLVAIQTALALSASPYYFSYYNPLLGGGRRAVVVMQIGWGEGLDEAARYLNSKPNADQLLVISAYAIGPFSYFSRSLISKISYDEAWTEENQEQFDQLDYAVIYIHQWQRNVPDAVLERLRDKTPEHTIWIDGLEYVRIYRIRGEK